MSVDELAALLLFAFVSSITPGPNNLMLLASGVNFGFRRTVPHMLGIAVGFCLLLVCVGLGIGTLMESFPALHVVLQLAGAGYLLYLAWRIALARALGDGPVASRPLGFVGAVAFQWVNVKAWMVGLSAIALFTDPDSPYASVLLVAVAFSATGLPSIAAWAGCGTMLRAFLDDPLRLKWFNAVMAVLLVLTLVPMLR